MMAGAAKPHDGSAKHYDGAEKPHDADALLQKVLGQARTLGIPVSPRIFPQVRINQRARTRFGCCVKQGGDYRIEAAEKLLFGPEFSLCQTLAHEVLHTCPGCINHGKAWQAYAKRMNEAYGYRISRTASCRELAVEAVVEPKHLVVCTKCGTEFYRLRNSRLIRQPERYRCRCGGRLERRY
ncbi:MAG: SprT-like domain-containing protein [Peptococcaceae bacterium]|nr:SprT-like domain-containing protein [Peptococcaceae bacterium]